MQSKSGYSLFTKVFTTSFPTILVYVDDLVVVGNDMHEIQSMKNLLDVRFKIKDLGERIFFFGDGGCKKLKMDCTLSKEVLP